MKSTKKKKKAKPKKKERISAKLYDNGGSVDSVAPPPSLPAESAAAATLPAPRSDKGQFLPGQSGNPKGREKGSKNYLVEVRRNTEIALRDYFASPEKQQLAQKAIDRLFMICLTGDEKNAVGALKLLMDKLMVSPRAEEADAQVPTTVNIIIDNKTSEHQAPVEVIDLPPQDYEEI